MIAIHDLITHLNWRIAVAKSEQPLEPTSTPESENQGWIKPEIVSFKPVEAAEGISYTPRDGLSNLTV